jgi:acyl-CoA synthetase (AMP-forming)/AMP-acid ligase II
MDGFFELMFGIAKAAAVIAPIQWRLAAPEIQQILSDAQPKLLFIGSEQLDKIDDLCIDGYPRECNRDGVRCFADFSTCCAKQPKCVSAEAIEAFTASSRSVPRTSTGRRRPQPREQLP